MRLKNGPKVKKTLEAVILKQHVIMDNNDDANNYHSNNTDNVINDYQYYELPSRYIQCKYSSWNLLGFVQVVSVLLLLLLV